MSMILILLLFDHSAIKEDQEAMAWGKEKEIGIDQETQGTDKVISAWIYFDIHMAAFLKYQCEYLMQYKLVCCHYISI